MDENEYQEFLKKAPPDHFSDEFIQFLREKNKVIEETDNWLIIENCKDPKDYTAFYIQKSKHYDSEDYKMYLKNWGSFVGCLQLLGNYKDREWTIKAPHKRSVQLFHVHLYLKP